MAKNKSYDEEFKKMIVELYESHTTTAANIVREYDIGSATLYKWVGQYGKIQTPDGEVTNIVKKYRPASSSKKVNSEGKENLLNQEFQTNELREKMVSDITYIYVKNYGWTYLATVEDLCSRAIIGYSYGKTIDADLVIEAIRNAQMKGKFKEQAIFHSDLGSQYTSNKVEKYLKELGLRHSYSKKGYPYDNACMESFNAILKKEEVNLKEYETFEEAKMALFEFIEGWYNRKRIHSAINYQIPYEIEKMSA